MAELPPDDAALVSAVESANLPTLMLVMAHLSGDLSLVRGAIRPRRGSLQHPDGRFPEEDARQVRRQALDILRSFREGGGLVPPLPSTEVLHEMMSFSLGQEVPPEYVPMMLQDMGLPDREVTAIPAAPAGFRALVIGAGVSGLLAAIKLGQAGIEHTVIEKNSEIGGTWFENTYPGCRVDLPSHFYAYSFEPNHDWKEHFARGEEILAYLRRVADKYGVRGAAWLETEVVSATYDRRRAGWEVTCRARDGRERKVFANVVISAVGQLNRPSIPSLPGMDDFAGPAFHSATWRHDVDLRRKRVGVIGTGASAMQIVPQLAGATERLFVFQRSPQWAISAPDYFRPVSEGERWLLRHVPFYAAWFRFRQFYLNGDGVHESLQVDPSWPHPRRSLNESNDRVRQMLTQYIEREIGERTDLLPKVLPDYPPFGKRMLIDNRWFRTLLRDDVELVTDPIERVTKSGVRLASGAHHDLDAIVFATGFHANRFLWPMTITGVSARTGRPTLTDRWRDDPRAYLGITVPEFPNFFMLYGPNTNLAHGGSIPFHGECQMRYILGCLGLLFSRGKTAIECEEAVHDEYNARVDAAHARMVWTQPNVKNWFLSAAGRVCTHSPFRLVDYWAMTRAPRPDDFRLT
jgi:4-hydroxyacetophenone monooxygenase